MNSVNKVLLVILLHAFPLITLAHEGNDHYGPHMMWQGYGMMMGPFMMILFLAVIVVVGVMIFRWLSGKGPLTGSGEDPIEILKARLARGEIDKEEYEERLQILRDRK